ncbi:HSP20-like chaperone [Phlyctochytrium arcticum]|nr:HSP20-like chaperone [Phlyctochytrium arcticum]
MAFMFDNDLFFNDPFFREAYARSRAYNPMHAFTADWTDLPSSSSRKQHQKCIGGNDNACSGSSSDGANTDNNNKQVSSTRSNNSPFGVLSSFARSPKLDLTESPNSYTVRADLPGLSKSDVRIHVEDDNQTLVLEGERKTEHEEKTDRRHVIERSFGQFQRRIRLPPDAQVDSAKATMENGVLKIELAKREPPKEEGRRQIVVS